MNIERALAIEGWMNEPELRWLADAASRSDLIAEVGCWMGRSTRALADNTQGTVYAIDHWLGSEEHQSALVDKPPLWLHNVFLRNMEGLDNVVPVMAPSVEAATAFRDLRFDMVFIDASHDYDSVKADILAWRPLVRPGGILCGHDRGYGPVYQATTELLGALEGETDIWCVRL